MSTKKFKSKKECRNCGLNFVSANSAQKYCSPLCYHIDVLTQMEQYNEYKQMFEDCIKNGDKCDEPN